MRKKMLKAKKFKYFANIVKINKIGKKIMQVHPVYTSVEKAL